MRKLLIAASTLMVVSSVNVGSASAGEFSDRLGNRIDSRLDRKGERIDDRLARRGAAIDDRFEARSAKADENGRQNAPPAWSVGVTVSKIVSIVGVIGFPSGSTTAATASTTDWIISANKSLRDSRE